MRQGLTALATARPRLIYLVTLTLSLAAAALMLRIQVDTDPENMLPATRVDGVRHQQVEATLSLHDAWPRNVRAGGNFGSRRSCDDSSPHAALFS